MYKHLHNKKLLIGIMYSMLGYCTILLVFTESLYACSTPVFLYARENWFADKYTLEITYTDDTALTPEFQQAVEKLNKPAEVDQKLPNLKIFFSKTTDDSGIQKKGTARLRVYYPGDISPKKPLWVSECNGPELEKIIDSPLRKKIVSELTGKTSAVWIFIESGQRNKDEQFLQLLKKQLANYTPGPQLSGDPVWQAAVKESGIAFSILSVNRDDPSESFLVKSLLSTEPDLKDSTEPMAFPIFGRGRILYALVGDGINPDTIRTACGYITGICSCELKKDNPGVDLLLNADWSRFSAVRTTAQNIPLIGLGSTEIISPEVINKDNEKQTKASAHTNTGSFLYAVLGSIAVLVICVIAVTVFLRFKFSHKLSKQTG